MSSIEHRRKLTFLEMLQSTLWAALGVQKSANRRRDFTHGSWVPFVVMGVAFTALFVVGLIGLVNAILAAT